MIPVLPNLIKEMVGGDTATAAHLTGLFAITWGLMQFFCSPIQGMLSDRFFMEQRPVLDPFPGRAVSRAPSFFPVHAIERHLRCRPIQKPCKTLFTKSTPAIGRPIVTFERLSD